MTKTEMDEKGEREGGERQRERKRQRDKETKRKGKRWRDIRDSFSP